ncbi:hypothetical protein BQ8794_50180 [Mesorhizobium prunaredense]|uniref:Uncharacterized protein n=1 Tax=Mesorhizobium prunaredense TaxID=1631249 RepID=A0A1R3VDU3_9HYPH|nr:hypothetical protein BQ8794_50180 [Mesorhizobium prunaredense]
MLFVSAKTAGINEDLKRLHHEHLVIWTTGAEANGPALRRPAVTNRRLEGSTRVRWACRVAKK